MDEAIKVELEDGCLWKEFNDVTNEMIVTKTGRRMFPFIRVRISNLECDAIYSVRLDFHQTHSMRCKFVNGVWTMATASSKNTAQSKVDQKYYDDDAEVNTDEQNCYVHSDSPNFGKFWMRDVISFGRVKLNNKQQCNGQIYLESLRRYTPNISIFRIGDTEGAKVAKFQLPLTSFIAVTAYQNEAITALKIKHNPFAKAFQENKSRSEKDEFQEPDSSSYRNLHPDYNWSTSEDQMLLCDPGKYGDSQTNFYCRFPMYKLPATSRFYNNTFLPATTNDLYNQSYVRYAATYDPINTNNNINRPAVNTNNNIHLTVVNGCGNKIENNINKSDNNNNNRNVGFGNGYVVAENHTGPSSYYNHNFLSAVRNPELGRIADLDNYASSSFAYRQHPGFYIDDYFLKNRRFAYESSNSYDD